MSNEITIPQEPSTLAVYNRQVDLVEVRRDAVTYPRISATPRDQAVRKMVSLVYAAFLYRGQEIIPEKVRFIASALVDEIMVDPHFGLSTLSWMEIGIVIRRAVLGGAKELYGVSVASLYSALVEYAKTEGHEASKKANQ